jgi:hypothetical protein
MYQHGLAYRIVNLDGSKIPLGRGLDQALRRYYVIMSKDKRTGAADPLCVATIWQRHKKGAKQRGLTFTISQEDVAAIIEDQGRVCAVTGLAFRLDKPEGMRIRPWAASLDRIDGRLGYEPGNVRVVCAFVNVAMNGFGELFFQQVLEPLIDAAVKARAWASENGQFAPSNTVTGIYAGTVSGFAGQNASCDAPK